MILLDEAAEMLLDWNNILVVSHASPDGDTLGSATALMRGLESLGKRVSFMCADKIGSKYEYLFDGIRMECEAYDHVVCVDVADPLLLGKAYDSLKNNVNLAIDHHGTHVPFGKCEYVDPSAAANCQIVYELLNIMGVVIDKPMADCLFTGISTDTGCFKYRNADAKTHRIAANLIDLGADAAEINRVMFDTKTRACVEVERKVMKDMEFFHGDKIAVIAISRQVVADAGADESDLEGIPSISRSIEGVFIGITLKEKENGVWKASVRTIDPVDATEICSRFGGGGHKGAAGCSFTMSCEEAKRLIVAECDRYLSAIGL